MSLQIDVFKKEGCEKIFPEKFTSTTKERPVLHVLLSQLRKDDTIIIWKLDRLGRSLKDLLAIVSEIHEKGANLHSLNDQIDTTTPTGKLTFHLFAALAAFERDIISERTKAGLEAARARGRVGGQPKGLSEKARIRQPIVAVQSCSSLRGFSYFTLIVVIRYFSPNIPFTRSNQLLQLRVRGC